jgi:hypothetical protein
VIRGYTAITDPEKLRLGESRPSSRPDKRGYLPGGLCSEAIALLEITCVQIVTGGERISPLTRRFLFLPECNGDSEDA